MTATVDEFDMLRMQIRETAACISSIKADITTIKLDVAVLKERSDHAMEKCPMRERIAGAEGNIAHLRENVIVLGHGLNEALELAHKNRLSLAERSVPVAIGGGVVAIIVALIEVLPRLIK